MTTYRRRSIDIYGGTIYHARTVDEWAAVARRLGGALGEVNSVGRCELVVDTEANAPVLVVYVERADPGQELSRMVTATHEAVHAGAMLLDHIGQPYDGGSEALAYLVEWIAAWLWNGL